ncbi:hypothetical protein RhiLY_03281 [Ceratobasidium sp. AG-Ba]|nr:hypothetical protein RhiLY_03281 [Ceratobasidium sp. AG-Ba]
MAIDLYFAALLFVLVHVLRPTLDWLLLVLSLACRHACDDGAIVKYEQPGGSENDRSALGVNQLSNGLLQVCLQNSVPFPGGNEAENIAVKPRHRQRCIARVHEVTELTRQPKPPTHARSLPTFTDTMQPKGISARVARRGATVPNVVSYESFAILQTPTTSRNSLENSLYQGSSDLRTDILSFLVIACGTEDEGQPIQDPRLDTMYLYDILNDADGILFESLLERDATLDKIRKRTTQLWEEAASGSCLLLLLTGHGDIDNAMKLCGGERIDEAYLDELFKSLPPKNLRVIVIFDICRENRDKAVAPMSECVSLVWTCSPGQRAFALRFNSFCMPSSFFLIGLFMAFWDMGRDPEGRFEDQLRLRITQLARFNNHVEHRKACQNCQSGELCPQTFEMRDAFAQDIDLEQARGSLEELHKLLMRIPRFYELSNAVAAFIMDNRPFLRCPMSEQSSNARALSSRGQKLSFSSSNARSLIEHWLAQRLGHPVLSIPGV